MKFSDRTSNQSTCGRLERMCPKWTVRSPTPTPRSCRFQRFISVQPAQGFPDCPGGRKCGTPHQDVRIPLDYALQPPLPLQEALSFFSTWVASTGTLQPPLPLQVFLPAQPLSPPLQPPWPLHSFLPEQSCLAEVAQPPLPLHSF